jgi:hypothetical protein
MRELPAGTATFLFADVEGSTRLLHELGDGYAMMTSLECGRERGRQLTLHEAVEFALAGDA